MAGITSKLLCGQQIVSSIGCDLFMVNGIKRRVSPNILSVRDTRQNLYLYETVRYL